MPTHADDELEIIADGERAQGKVDVVVQMQGPMTNEGDTPPTLTVGGRYDLEFRKLAIGWRITRRHMRTRYSSRTSSRSSSRSSS